VCVVSLALSLAGFASVDAGFPAYARVEGHVEPGAIGLVFVINTVTIVCLQLVFLRLLKGRRRTTALGATGMLWALSWVLLGLVSVGGETARLAVLLTYGGLFGVGEILMAPSMQPLVNVIATDRLRGRYNALSGLMFSVSLVAAPVMSSVLIGNGLGHLWILGMVACGVVAALVAVRLRAALTDEQDGLASRTCIGISVVP
jgi:MFS family permease